MSKGGGEKRLCAITRHSAVANARTLKFPLNTHLLLCGGPVGLNACELRRIPLRARPSAPQQDSQYAFPFVLTNPGYGQRAVTGGSKIFGRTSDAPQSLRYLWRWLHKELDGGVWQ